MTTYPVKWHQVSHGYNDKWEDVRLRESFVYITERGAIEGWRTPLMEPFYGDTHVGGIEVRSKTPLYEGHKPNSTYCFWTRGECYHDGSSLAFDLIEPIFNSPEMVFDVLSEWSTRRFGEDVGDE